MDRNIKVTIEDRIATAEGDPSVICGNSVYTVTFTFDDEWEDFEVKTARFKYMTPEGVQHTDLPFTGDTVEVPKLFDTREVEVGVYAGNLTTSTGAAIRCEPGIRCGGGEEADPDPDKYDALMELIKNGPEDSEAADHSELKGRDKEGQHPIAAIEGLRAELDARRRTYVPIPAREIKYENPYLVDQSGSVQAALDEAIGFVVGHLPDLVAKKHSHNNAEALNKISEADGKLTYNGAPISSSGGGERPTASLFVGQGEFAGYLLGDDSTLVIISWDIELLPVGTEIKTIKLYFDGAWIDIRELNKFDNIAYALNMHTSYIDETETGGLVYALMHKTGGVWGAVATALQTEDIERLEIIYYTDGGAA